MDFACSHCTTALHIDNQQLGMLWNYVRCSDCAKLQLVHPNESKTIRIEKTPEAERIVLALAIKHLDARAMNQKQVLNLSEDIKSGKVNPKGDQFQEGKPGSSLGLTKAQSTNEGNTITSSTTTQTSTPPPFKVRSVENQTDRLTPSKTYSDQEFDAGISNRLRDSIRYAREAKKKERQNFPLTKIFSVLKSPSGFGGMMTGLVVLVSGLALLHTSRMIMNESTETTGTSKPEQSSKVKKVNQNSDSTSQSDLSAGNGIVLAGKNGINGRPPQSTLETTSNLSNFKSTEKPTTNPIQERHLASQEAPEKVEVILKPKQINTRLRVGPGVQYKVVRTANVDETFRVLSWKENWFEVESMKDPGLTYWVRNDLVTRSEIKY